MARAVLHRPQLSPPTKLTLGSIAVEGTGDLHVSFLLSSFPPLKKLRFKHPMKEIVEYTHRKKVF